MLHAQLDNLPSSLHLNSQSFSHALTLNAWAAQCLLVLGEELDSLWGSWVQRQAGRGESFTFGSFLHIVVHPDFRLALMLEN